MDELSGARIKETICQELLISSTASSLVKLILFLLFFSRKGMKYFVGKQMMKYGPFGAPFTTDPTSYFIVQFQLQGTRRQYAMQQ